MIWTLVCVVICLIFVRQILRFKDNEFLCNKKTFRLFIILLFLHDFPHSYFRFQNFVYIGRTLYVKSCVRIGEFGKCFRIVEN